MGGFVFYIGADVQEDVFNDVLKRTVNNIEDEFAVLVVGATFEDKDDTVAVHVAVI